MLTRANGWKRPLALIGAIDEGGDPFFAAAEQAIDAFQAKALEILSDNALNLCLKEHKPEMIQRLRSVEKQAQLLKLPVNLRTKEKVEQCGKFELVFESLITMTWALDQITWVETLHGKSTVQIVASVDELLNASAPLTYKFDLKYTVQGVNCSISEARGVDDVFRVSKIEDKSNPKEDEDPCPSKGRAARGSGAQGRRRNRCRRSSSFQCSSTSVIHPSRRRSSVRE